MDNGAQPVEHAETGGASVTSPSCVGSLSQSATVIYKGGEEGFSVDPRLRPAGMTAEGKMDSWCRLSDKRAVLPESIL
jgi:hypothetical protein